MELASSRTLPGHDRSASARSASRPIERTGDVGRALAGLRQEVRRQRGDVLAAIAQRRDVHRQDVEAEVEVLAEAPLLDEGRQVAVRRGDHADVDVMDAIAAHGAHVAELQDAQQLGLQAEGHVANLVEQQRPAVGLGEQPLAGLDGAREAAPRVPEDLALEQLLRDGGRVDRDERAAARALRAWMARATSSLPTPVSPVTSTGALDRATKSIAVCSVRIAGPAPDEGHVATLVHGRRGDARALARVQPRVERAGDDPAQLARRRTV